MNLQFLIPLFIFLPLSIGIYGIFELFVRRKERLAIIEKASEGLDPALLAEQLMLFKTKKGGSYAIKIGCLLVGIGLGALLVAILEIAIPSDLLKEMTHRQRDALSAMYLAAILLFGGASLLTAYFLERKLEKKEKNKL